MNLRQIEAFRAIMITGSATEAAKMLYISQPAVSRLISDLEYRTNLVLFDRKPNRLTPTPEAREFYRHVERSFTGLDTLRQSAEAIANQQLGSIRVGAMPVCVDSFLPKLVHSFLKTHANVAIELESASRNITLELLHSQRIDFGIISTPFHEREGLKVRPFCQHQAVCVLPKNHPLCKKTEISAEDLENEAFISLSLGSPFRTRIDEIFVSRGIQRKIAIEARTQRTIYELVRLGSGVAILDPFIVNKLDSEVCIKPFKPDISWEFAIVHSSAIQLSLAAEAFIDNLISHFEVK